MMMTPGQRRAARRAAATAAAAAVTWGLSGLPGKAMLRGPVAFLAVAAAGNLMMQARTSAKAASTEARLNAHIAATAPAVALIANGGAIGGPITAPGTAGWGPQGSSSSDADSDGDMGTISSSQTLSGLIGNCNTILGQVNNLKHQHNALVTDCGATINRVNALLTALG